MNKTIKKIRFAKMHGLGNDYIYIDCFSQSIDSPQTLAVSLSDRHFGIGGDGIVLIKPPSNALVSDARMQMFNMDGSEGEMCGNAIRCVGKYLYDAEIVRKENLRIETASGVKQLHLMTEEGKVSAVTVDMGVPEHSPERIPVLIDGCKSIVDYPLEVEGQYYNITCVSVGNPHCVVFIKDVDHFELEKIGSKFENHIAFPNRINTEFVEVVNKNTIKMRVFERGSGETLACGTGACASVVAATLNGFCTKGEEIRVILRGGDLSIRYDDNAIRMTGTATKVFEGVIEVEQ